LAAALRQRRLFELHSGALVDPESGKGLLIIGPSGSGKSTLTVQLAAAGWSFLTDDVLLLSRESAHVQAWPLRRCFAVTSDTFAASRFLQTRISFDSVNTPSTDKYQFLPHAVFAAEFQDRCIPRTLFFSELSGGDRSSVSRLAPGDTMARLIRMSPWSCYDRSTAVEHLRSTGHAG
jgi:ABC-type iron transport system FetAB ATPase subunit